MVFIIEVFYNRVVVWDIVIGLNKRSTVNIGERTNIAGTKYQKTRKAGSQKKVQLVVNI